MNISSSTSIPSSSSYRYDLSDIEPSFGKELLNDKENGKVHISFSIFPNDDLYDFITSAVVFNIVIPNDYHNHFKGLEIGISKQNLQTCPSLQSIFINYIHMDTSSINSLPSNLDLSRVIKLSIPWLSVTANINLSVWFYTIRYLLRNPNVPTWFPPIPITRKLIDSYSLIPKDYDDIDLSYKLSIIHGSGRVTGKRQYMEDREFIFPTINITNERTIGFYGILDGHGGSDCSQSVAEELPSKVTQCLRMAGQTINYPKIICDSFLSTDEWFLKTDSSNSGSTATIITWDGSKEIVYIANTGDTRAVLCRSGTAIDLSKDRKATDPEEIARIIMNGGIVSNNRVMGSLAITRAFGDKHLKKYNHSNNKNRSSSSSSSIATTNANATATSNNINIINSNNKSNTTNFTTTTIPIVGDGKILTVEPEITIADIRSDLDEFILLATDGLWDVMTSQDAITMARNLIRSQLPNQYDSSLNVSNLNKIADQMANHAVQTLGSLDNVTVMILLFHRSNHSNISPSSSHSSSPMKDVTKTLHTARRMIEIYGTKVNLDYLNPSTISTFDSILFASTTSITTSSTLPISTTINMESKVTEHPSTQESVIGSILLPSYGSNSNNDNSNHSSNNNKRKNEGVDDILDFLLDDSNF